MKMKVIGILILSIIYMNGCTVRKLDDNGRVVWEKNYGPSLSSNDTALNEKELRKKIINHEVYRNGESFFVLDNHIMFYYDKVTREREYGTWFIRRVFNPTREEYVDSFCILKGQSYKGVDNDTQGMCMRFYPEKDKHHNLYLGVNVRHCTGFKNTFVPITCNIDRKYTHYYRIKKSSIGK